MLGILRNNMIKKLILLIILVIFTACSSSKGKTEVDLNKLPADPTILQGELDNGLKYYIKKNMYPDDKVELRLNVRTGSLNETEEERGLAHFVEHMAFNGTKNFKGNGVIEFMENLGLTFGKHTNAYTSTNVTNYQLSVPLDKTEMFDKSFIILRDWADGLLFNPEEIEREKGVIVEEWRMRDDSKSRIRKQLRAFLLDGSLHPLREPIGLMDVVRGADRSLLKRYYDKWYTADNMSVIVVGNIEPSEIEDKIKEVFSDMSDRKSPKPVDASIPLKDGLRFKTITDEEAKGLSFMLSFMKHQRRPETYDEYKDNLLEQGVAFMINKRISRKKLENKTDLLGMRMHPSQVADDTVAYSFNASFKEDRFREDLEDFFTEIEKFKRYGFEPAELAEFKKVMSKTLKRRARPDEVFESSNLASYISKYDRSGGDLLSPVQELEVYEKTISSLNITSFNRKLKDMLNIKSMAASMTLPYSLKGKINLSKQDVENLIAKVEKKEITKDSVLGGKNTLIDKKPQPAQIVKKGYIDKTNTHLYEYANGSKLLIRPSDINKHKYIVSAIRLGGLSEIKDDKSYRVAANIQSVISTSGFKDLSKVNVSRILAGHRVKITPSASEMYEMISGGGDTDDIELAFQLMRLYLTSFEITDDSFAPAKDTLEKGIKDVKRNRFAMFMRSVLPKAYNNKYRRAYLTNEDLESIKASDFAKIYKELFADVDGYVFCIAGDVDPEEAAKLFAVYIGSIPPSGRVEGVFSDRGVRFSSDDNTFIGEGSVEPKTTVVLRYENDEMQTSTENIISSALVTKVINKHLRENIREARGGVYSIRGKIMNSPLKDGYTSGYISFTCAPERADELIDAVRELLTSISSRGISEEELNIAKDQLILITNESLQRNNVWASILPLYYLLEKDNWKTGDLKAEMTKVSTANANRFLRDFMRASRHFTVRFEPEDNK